MAARRLFPHRAAPGPGSEASTVRFDDGVESVRAGARSVEDVTAELVAALTDEELLGVLDGDVGFWTGGRDVARNGYNHEPVVAGEVERLGIPGIRFTDGPRGVVMNHSTCFPVAIARGATWDPELETEIGEAIGAEARAQGANLFAGVCVNLLRHPGWGRAQETFGDDPVLLGAMGAALVTGVQRHVMACVKHFALNSIENARFRIDVRVSDADLHEVYLPHFRTVIDAGCAAVMSAYNSVNGEWCGDSPTLLTDILRDEWGFEGFVMSDFVFGTRDPVGSVAAGLDLEMPFAQQRAAALPKALAKGRLDRLDAERAAGRSIAAQVRWAASVAPDPPSEQIVASGAHRALARRAASRSMVLLRNEAVDGRPVLPLHLGPAGPVRSVAVIGTLAAAANLGDHGSSAVRPPSTVSPIEGLRAALRDVTVDAVSTDDPRQAAAAAEAADAAVVVVGYTARDEGEAVFAMDRETMRLLPGVVGGRALSALTSRLLSRTGAGGLEAGGDRTRLTLRPEHEELIDAVTAVNRHTIVVVIGGSAVIMEHWRQRVAAILLAWYPGMEGGHALADVLTGAVEPGGRLPFVMPTSAYHLPPFDPDATSITYDRWWGQRRLDRDGHEPAYPLGFGLGYTTFEIESAHVASWDVDHAAGRVQARVRNTGDRHGGLVVQCHAVRGCADGGAHDAGGSATGGRTSEVPARRLLGFARIEAPADETVDVDVVIDLHPLAERDPATGAWAVPSGNHRIELGRWWADPGAATVTFDGD